MLLPPANPAKCQRERADVEVALVVMDRLMESRELGSAS